MKTILKIVTICFVLAGLILTVSIEANAKHGSYHKHKSEKSTCAKREGMPPGWCHGKKTGWGGAKYPPGWSKWNDKKKAKWRADRDVALTEIDGYLVRYHFQRQEHNEVIRAFDQALGGGAEIERARRTLVSALKDERRRRWLMVDTTQRVLELLK